MARTTTRPGRMRGVRMKSADGLIDYTIKRCGGLRSFTRGSTSRSDPTDVALGDQVAGYESFFWMIHPAFRNSRRIWTARPRSSRVSLNVSH